MANDTILSLDGQEESRASLTGDFDDKYTLDSDNKFVVIFIDDILVYSRSEEEYDQHIRIVLQSLRECQLYAKFGKCELWLTKVVFLGHVVEVVDILLDPQNIKVVMEREPPKNVTEVHSFLNLTGYYYHFIKGFSMIASLLTKLLQKRVLFVWNEKRQESFELLK
ncbi:uncharacterized mitochondrial protein AtMg00860-like [Hibiscus syriacus]|uniref:uncharacterized mitochondrial protein AtMg00860-like n=1 Tax=Hibiscus syriacus TaxID=106335 RepID=UPI0019240111|nr:uncharacterized mitochondrial protein AtMg00860-like [Hibiscus syriacus]